MSDILYRLKKMTGYTSYAFVFCAFILIVINIIALVPAELFDNLYSSASKGVSVAFSVISCLLITYYICKNSKKAIAAGGCLVFFDLVLFSLCSVHISFVIGLALSLLFAFVFSKNSLLGGAVICFFVALVIDLIMGLSNDLTHSALKALCLGLKGRGALFGTVNNLYSILFSDNLSELFLNKSYSGTAFANGKVISGVLNIYKAQQAAGINSSKYLAGKYFVNIFVSFGVYMVMFSRLEKEEQTGLTLCLILSVIFGDVRLFALFILIYNPLMYLGWLLTVLISYLTARLLDIKLVYFRQGSIFELIKYRSRMIYFIVAGVVIAALCYFLQRLILSKFDFQSRRILPFEVRRIIDALGGNSNIERISGSELYVKNANLIDILRLDCDIRGNLVTLNYDDMKLLKKFIAD